RSSLSSGLRMASVVPFSCTSGAAAAACTVNHVNSIASSLATELNGTCFIVLPPLCGCCGYSDHASAQNQEHRLVVTHDVERQRAGLLFHELLQFGRRGYGPAIDCGNDVI